MINLALEHSQKFLTLWKDANPGIAEIDDAKGGMGNLAPGVYIAYIVPDLIISKEDLGTISIPGLTSAEFKQVLLNATKIIFSQQVTKTPHVIRTAVRRCVISFNGI